MVKVDIELNQLLENYFDEKQVDAKSQEILLKKAAELQEELEKSEEES